MGKFKVFSGMEVWYTNSNTMAELKTDHKKEQRKILSLGGGTSYGVTLPREWIDTLGWKKRQKLTLTLARGRIIVADWKKSPRKGSGPLSS